MMKRISLITILMLILTFIVFGGCRITGHPTSGTITANKNTLHFEVHGNGDQALVLIHGWSNNLHFWDGQIDEMAKDVPKSGWEASLANCFSWLNTSGTAAIKSLDIPVLAINGDHQETETAIVRKYCPQYKARIIEGVYHVVPWESPEQFTRYLLESIEDIRSLSPAA